MYRDAALMVIAQTYADGDRESPQVLAVFKKFVDTLGYERRTTGDADADVDPMFQKAISEKMDTTCLLRSGLEHYCRPLSRQLLCAIDE